MKKITLLLIGALLLTSPLCYAQTLDHAQLECLYSYEMVGNRLQLEKKTKDEAILLVGSRYCAYFSYMNYVRDSLIEANPAEYGDTFDGKPIPPGMKNVTLGEIAAMVDKSDGPGNGTRAFGIPGKMLPFNLYNHEHYLINREQGELWCMDQVRTSSLCYTEIAEKPAWEIGSDTCTVAGYRCQKATARYGGREWTAWFSPEIALSEGPWKLRGLPGLILKAETADGEFALTCTLIRRSTGRPIVKDEQRKYRNVSKEELFKMKKQQFSTPLVGATLTRPGREYNFIERMDSK